jgi:hypothetical protein
MPKAIPMNVDYFEPIVSLVLLRLYAAFPSRLDVTASDFNLSAVDLDEEPARLIEIWRDAIGWLESEGLVQFSRRTVGKQTPDVGFEGLVLTRKGIASMYRKSDLQSQQTLGDALLIAVNRVETLMGNEELHNLVQKIISHSEPA